MSSEDFGDFFTGVVIIALIVFGCVAVYTDEYEVNKKEECIEYSQSTGQCVKRDFNYVCKVNNGEEVVAICGQDFDKCNAICNMYNE